MFDVLKEKWGKIDFVVHAIAFSDKDQLDGRYLETTADNFSKTMLISCYSLTAIAQRAEKLMTDGGSILTLTYYGAEKWMPHYNVMGVAKAALEASVRYLAADLGEKNIRVNAISAGPIKTLAASGIGDFRYILKWNEYNAPLRRTVTIEEVGDSALYLLSDMSRGVTGEVHHVDSGYHVVGMKRPTRRISRSAIRGEGIACKSIPTPISTTSAMARPWNAEGRLQGSQDIPLNDLGREQAAHAGDISPTLCARRARVVAAFVASPLGRARSTMELVRGALELPPDDYALDDRLREIGYGHWEGSTLAEMQAADPELFASRQTENGRAAAGRRELRLGAAADAGLVRLAAGDTVAVAHGGTARALMVALGFETPVSAADLYIEQGAVYVFRDGGLRKYS